MSTNSVVAYLRSDGSIVSSYVHYDGYETGVGMTLLEHYNSDERALAVSVGWQLSFLIAPASALVLPPRPLQTARLLPQNLVFAACRHRSSHCARPATVRHLHLRPSFVARS